MAASEQNSQLEALQASKNLETNPLVSSKLFDDAYKARPSKPDAPILLADASGAIPADVTTSPCDDLRLDPSGIAKVDLKGFVLSVQKRQVQVEMAATALKLIGADFAKLDTDNNTYQSSS